LSSRFYRFLRASLLALCVLVMVPVAGGAAGSTSVTTTIGRGVTYTKTVDPAGPWRIYVVKVALARESSVDVALSNDKLAGAETVTSMSRRHNAIAAINGDYMLKSGRPVNAFSEDGVFAQTTLAAYGLNFLPSASGASATVAHPSNSARLIRSSGVTHVIAKVNAGPPTSSELALFNRYGDGLETPPPFACSARLFRVSKILAADPDTKAGYKVDAVVCRDKPLETLGGVVVAATRSGTRAREIKTLTVGQRVTLAWSHGATSVFDTLGGNPWLVKGGLNVAPHGTTYPYTRQPRTGVGITKEGRVLLVVVDGRRPGFSVGMTFREFGALFVRLGADRALNLDGGGGAEMVVKGQIVNRPSSDRERPATNAVLVLSGADPGEIGTAIASGSTTARTGSRSGAVGESSISPALWDQIVHDPASTGGLAVVMEDQGEPLSVALRSAARAFQRSSR
jgi:Phosphodiester glycosidase